MTHNTNDPVRLLRMLRYSREATALELLRAIIADEYARGRLDGAREAGEIWKPAVDALSRKVDAP